MGSVEPGSILTFVRDVYLYRQDADGSVTVDASHEVRARKGDPALAVGEVGHFVDVLFRGDVFTCKKDLLLQAAEAKEAA